jgi:hypothetical protein
MSSSPVMATMGTAKVRGAKVGHLDRDVGRVALLQRFGLLQHHVVVVRRQFYATVRGHGDDGELVICWPPPAMVTYWSNPALAAPSVLTDPGQRDRCRTAVSGAEIQHSYVGRSRRSFVNLVARGYSRSATVPDTEFAAPER